MKKICEYIAGSRGYGISLPSSDKDVRYLFLNESLAQIVGLERNDIAIQKIEENEDIIGYELRHFFKLLHGGRIAALEFIFNEDWIFKSSEWQLILEHRSSLLDSEKIFAALSGYCFSEKHLILGERTGRLGAKRAQSIKKHSYSEKNFANFLRLCHAGSVFFQDGVFPVYLPSKYPVITEVLLKIKEKPQTFDLSKVIELMNFYEAKLQESFSKRKFNFVFDAALANKLIAQIYFPIYSHALST